MAEDATIGTWDTVVIVIYFVFVLAVGLWATWRAMRGTMEGYFLAGKSMVWWPVGASLFASNIGSEHFIGLAGTGAASGLAVGSFEFNAMFILLLLGWVFLPVYMAAGVFTMPEYLRRRFGGQRVRVYLAIIALILSIFTKISVNMFAGALFIQQALGWNLYLAIVIILAITALYTVLGGLSAVIYTDAAQTFIMVAGAIVLMILAFIKVPYSDLQWMYFEAIPNTTKHANISCGGIPPDDAFHIFRDPINSDLPWPGMIFGISISSIWYWCTDQVIVQRALAAKSLSHAKGGCVFAGFLKVLPMFLIVIPGMISRVLFTDDVACADPITCEEVCGNKVGCTNIAYPKLVLNLMPEGLRGLMMAVMMSALVSSLTSIFNSSSTIFTVDIYRRIRKQANERELLIVGRVFVLFLVGISILWVPIIQAAQGGRLFDYIQSITSYLAPPICAVYILAVAWWRVNEQGAFWGLMLGLLVGMIRLVLDFVYQGPACGEEDTRIAIIKNFHFLYFGIFLFLFVLVATIIISLITEPMNRDHLVRLTFDTRYSRAERQDDSVSEIEHDEDAEKKMQIDENEERSMSSKCMDIMCGSTQQSQQTEEERKKREKEMSDIREPNSKYTLLLNISAIVMFGCSVFLWGFFF
ncbi:sodium/glucose cotransporter 4-like isoform X2 [Ptychodera flava]|uniref:sodium/glucose cotransporter 4-like isoform X2 n=2 Tax=Ptychodera flava TaxID=63121 RepID=UPI003969F519